MSEIETKRNQRRLKHVVSIFNRVRAEMETLSEWLAEIPAHLAEIDAMEDEAARREAMVIVRDTMQRARNLRLIMYREIQEFEQRLGPVDADDDRSSAG